MLQFRWSSSSLNGSGVIEKYLFQHSRTTDLSIQAQIQASLEVDLTIKSSNTYRHMADVRNIRTSVLMLIRLLAVILVVGLPRSTTLAALSTSLRSNYYTNSCKNLQSIALAAFQAQLRSDARVGASIMRLHFHDCFVQVRVLLLVSHQYQFDRVEFSALCLIFGRILSSRLIGGLSNVRIVLS